MDGAVIMGFTTLEFPYINKAPHWNATSFPVFSCGNGSKKKRVRSNRYTASAQMLEGKGLVT